MMVEIKMTMRIDKIIRNEVKTKNTDKENFKLIGRDADGGR